MTTTTPGRGSGDAVDVDHEVERISYAARTMWLKHVENLPGPTFAEVQSFKRDVRERIDRVVAAAVADARREG